MDQNDHGLGVGAAAGRPDRRGSPHHGRHSIRLPSDRRGGRLPGQPERRGGDGRGREFRGHAERGPAAKALPREATVGVDPEERRRLLRLHVHARARALPARGDRTEGRPAADDDRLRAHSLGHADLALAGAPASVSLQVTRQPSKSRERARANGVINREYPFK